MLNYLLTTYLPAMLVGLVGASAIYGLWMVVEPVDSLTRFDYPVPSLTAEATD